MQHPWDNSTIFYQQVKESGIIPTFDGFCFPQKEKRETRFRCAYGIVEVKD